ncbi:MAG: thioredoxin domain-containing protein [Chloroflexaceae bacterium]|nr:thioredoxin domain-containing protein [Chloroflexaceae bacterium]
MSLFMAGLLTGCTGRPEAPPAGSAGATPSTGATGSQATARPAADPTPSPEPPDSGGPTMDTIIAQTRHFQGDLNAPVTIIEFSDFQCPYCSRFSHETLPLLKEQYLKPGIVRIGYRHAAYQGEGSFLAAEASECAADQNAFWDYHDRLIHRLAVEGKRDFTSETLKQFAAELGLDSETFNACLDEGKYAELVRSETEQLQSLGVSGTPTFLINGKRLIGAQPFELFQQTIDAARNGERDPSNMAVEMEEEEEEQPLTEDPAALGSPEELMAMLTERTRHFQGDPNAPITIIEFSDFQCPFCSRFSAETAPKIQAQYVETGLVRMGYLHAAYQGEGSFLAAEASECAADQNAFWDYHDRLVHRLAVEGKRDFTSETLKQFAVELGLDPETFNACLDEGKYAELVQNETQEVHQLGVTGTPTFIINGKGIRGAQPFEVFEQIIDSELEE